MAFDDQKYLNFHGAVAKATATKVGLLAHNPGTLPLAALQQAAWEDDVVAALTAEYPLKDGLRE